MRRSLAIGALLVLVAGCGGDDKSSKAKHTGAKHRRPTIAEARDIRATIAQLEGAIAHRDAPAVCRLYTEDAQQTETDLYATCATGVRSDLRREKPPRLAVGKIEVSFNRRARPRTLEASVAVTSSAKGRDPFGLDAVLVQERAAWRINDSVIDYLVKPTSDSDD